MVNYFRPPALVVSQTNFVGYEYPKIIDLYNLHKFITRHFSLVVLLSLDNWGKVFLMLEFPFFHLYLLNVFLVHINLVLDHTIYISFLLLV